jgi:hypothetical protein
MRKARTLAVVAAVLLPAAAWAQTPRPTFTLTPVHLAEAQGEGGRVESTQTTQAPAPAFVYSDGYRVRAKIHRIGSFAFLPLVVTQGYLGRELYNGASGGKKTAHKAVAFGIGGLFLSNSITGVMNLVEARKDPNKKKLRLAHGLLMMASDVGFLSTAILRPDTASVNYLDQRSRHRAIAITSIGLATTGYLLMIFGK